MGPNDAPRNFSHFVIKIEPLTSMLTSSGSTNLFIIQIYGYLKLLSGPEKYYFGWAPLAPDLKSLQRKIHIDKKT